MQNTQPPRYVMYARTYTEAANFPPPPVLTDEVLTHVECRTKGKPDKIRDTEAPILVTIGKGQELTVTFNLDKKDAHTYDSCTFKKPGSLSFSCMVPETDKSADFHAKHTLKADRMARSVTSNGKGLKPPAGMSLNCAVD